MGCMPLDTPLHLTQAVLDASTLELVSHQNGAPQIYAGQHEGWDAILSSEDWQPSRWQFSGW